MTREKADTGLLEKLDFPTPCGLHAGNQECEQPATHVATIHDHWPKGHMSRVALCDHHRQRYLQNAALAPGMCSVCFQSIPLPDLLIRDVEVL